MAKLAREHVFAFYEYQMADLSHTGKVELALATFDTIGRFVRCVLDAVDPDTTVVVTSDHDHLEQVGFTKGHPKSRVPTWYFGPEAEEAAKCSSDPRGCTRCSQADLDKA